MSQNMLFLFVIFCLFNCVVSQNTCPCSAYTFMEDSCIQHLEGGFCPDGEMIGPGTRVAKVEDWPYMLSFQWDKSDKGKGCYEHFCSGMLIAPNLAITAAHCFMGNFVPDEYEVVPLPEVYVAQVPPCRHFGSFRDQKRVNATKVHWSKFWIRSESSGDVAIVELDTDLPGPYLKLIDKKLESDFQSELRVCGYGAHTPSEHSEGAYNARQLYEADVVTLSEGTCDFFLFTFNDGRQESDLNYETMLCAYNQMADSCRGDSGGPAVIKGVVSIFI